MQEITIKGLNSAQLFRGDMLEYNAKSLYKVPVLFVRVSNSRRWRQDKVKQKGFVVEGVGRGRSFRRFASFFSFLPIFKICDKSFL